MGLGNPFRYKDWFNTHGEGATDTGDDVEVGRENIPDDRDSTIIYANTPENAALMGIFAGVKLEDDDDSGTPNSPPDAPGIGVYGGGKNSRGIGVAGACDTGTGVYGISTETGIGVVGRSLLITLQELLTGYAVGAVIGILLAGVITQFPFIEKVVTPYIILLVTTPMLALVFADMGGP